MRVRPATPGTIIRDPRTKRAIADEGSRVNESTFWRRRIASGDVVEIPDVEDGQMPTGLEPVTPLTTRGKPGAGDDR